MKGGFLLRVAGNSAFLKAHAIVFNTTTKYLAIKNTSRDQVNRGHRTRVQKLQDISPETRIERATH